MSLIQVLLERPAELPGSCRYTFACGIFYALFGLLTLVWPGHAQALFRETEFAGHEADLFRLIGLVLAVLGWLYLFGARTGGRQFVAATVLDRIVLVPLVLVPLALRGVFPHLLFTFVFVDPALAIGAWVLLRSEQRELR